MSMQMVRVKNVGDKPFKDGYANQTYEIKPGKEAFVPFDAAALWFGHPDVYDVSPRQRARFDQWKRLRTKYGAFDVAAKGENGVQVVTSADQMWERNKPQVEVYTLEGKRLTTVIDDPEGKTIGANEEQDVQNAGLIARQEYLERELEALRAAIRTTSDDDEDDEGGDDEDDGGDGGEDDSDPLLDDLLNDSDDEDDADDDSPTQPGVQRP